MSEPATIERIPAREYGEKFGFRESAVIHRIQTNIIEGVEENGTWFVIRKHAASSSPSAPVTDRTPQPEIEADTTKVVRYTSVAYVYSIIGLLSIISASDLIALILEPSGGLPEGLGLRIAVIAGLVTRHKWARAGVKIWAGMIVFAGGFGLFSLSRLDPMEYEIAWWGPVLFITFIIIGLAYLLTVNRFIKVEEVPT